MTGPGPTRFQRKSRGQGAQCENEGSTQCRSSATKALDRKQEGQQGGEVVLSALAWFIPRRQGGLDKALP